MGAPENFIEEEIRIFRMPWENRMEEHEFILENDEIYAKNLKKWRNYIPIAISGCLFELISKEQLGEKKLEELERKYK